ncbi:helix-turn-helix domain-containing protein [Mucilaginibacter sp.]
MVKIVKYRRDENAINTMAKNVRKYRKEKKLTIQELSNIANLEYAQLSKIERGLANSTISTLFEIANALGISPGQLLET